MQLRGSYRLSGCQQSENRRIEMPGGIQSGVVHARDVSVGEKSGNSLAVVIGEKFEHRGARNYDAAHH